MGAKGKKPKSGKKRPKSKGTRVEPKAKGEDIYYVVRPECGGDCSFVKLGIRTPTLVSIQPAPPAANRRAVEFDARLGFRTLLSEALRTIRRLSAVGDPFGVVAQMFLDGFGGQVLCDPAGPDCFCRPDRDNPLTRTDQTVTVPFPFSSNGVAYTAKFRLTFRLDKVNGACQIRV